MAALIGSSQPFPLRQICLNDLLNADLSSIVTSLSQPHGKMDDMSCSNLILDGTIEHKWDLNQSASELPASVESVLPELRTTDIQCPTKLSSHDRTVDVGGIFPNFPAQAVGRRVSFCFSDVMLHRC